MTAALLSLDEEVALRIDESLPEILGRFLLALDEEGPRGLKHGWRSWCAKHTMLLTKYTLAAIYCTKRKRAWRDDAALCRDLWCEHCRLLQQAEDALDSTRTRYRKEPCTCLIETITPLPDTGPRAPPIFMTFAE